MITKVIQADAKAALDAANEACRNMDGELDIDALTRAFASHADPLRRALHQIASAVDADGDARDRMMRMSRIALAALSSGENNNGE